MHHTEAVGHERARRSVGAADEFGQRLGQRQPLGVVLAGLARVEADVLQQQHVTVGQALGAGERVGADDVTGQLDVPAQFVAEGGRDGSQRELRVRSILGPAEVRGDDDLGARVRQRLQRRHRREDAAGVGDVALVVERDVQVGAHQHAPTLDAFGQQILE